VAVVGDAECSDPVLDNRRFQELVGVTNGG
jgi:hypothetical protein